MRTEGEITKDELANLRSQLDNEIVQLTEQKNRISEKHEQTITDKPDIAKIRIALDSIGSNPTEPISKGFLDKIVGSVVPNSDGVYEWNVDLGEKTEVVKLVSVGDKRSKKEKAYVHLYGQEADKSASALHNKNAVINVVRHDFITTQLHRRLSRIGISPKITISWDFPINFEMARAYQKANGRYLRECQWTDIVMTLALEIGK